MHPHDRNGTVTVDPSSALGNRLAMAHLAKAGKGSDYSADEYLDAVQATSLDRVLIEEGAFPDVEGGLVTPELLHDRVAQIVAEQGYGLGDPAIPGIVPSGVPDETLREAVRQAISEIGRVGEERRDAAEVASARRERLVDQAILARKIPNSQREMWIETLERSPDAAEAVFATMPVNPTLEKFSSVSGGQVILADDTSLELHTRAEAWLEKEGLAKRGPFGGDLQYTSEDYVLAGTHARDAMVVEATEAALTAQGVAKAKWTDDRGRESKVYAEARERAQLQIDRRIR